MTDYMMLWFENSTEPAEEKIQRAKLYYRDKYGQMPNFAELHPEQMPVSEIAGMQVISSKYMIRNNMLIGVAPRSLVKKTRSTFTHYSGPKNATEQS